MPKIKAVPDWFYARWKELCAIVFLMLVLFDFILAPIGYAILYKPVSFNQIVTESQKLSPEAQTVFITAAIASRPHAEWQPLTLGGNGLVYLCFLAILGIASWKGKDPIIGSGLVNTQDNTDNDGQNNA